MSLHTCIYLTPIAVTPIAANSHSNSIASNQKLRKFFGRLKVIFRESNP